MTAAHVKRWVLAAVLLAFLSSNAWSYDTGWHWDIGPNWVFFNRESNGPGGYALFAVCSYKYSGGKWVPACFTCGCPPWVFAGWMNITCGNWDGIITESGCSSPEEYALAYSARQLYENGFLLDYLNEVFPDGGNDPDFAGCVLALASAFQPPAPPDKQAFENSTGITARAEPVYMRNGEFEYSVTDLSIRGKVLPVQIVRTYGSRREYNSQFGYGWDINYNMKVRRLASIEGEPNVAVLLDGRGYQREYIQDNNSSDYLRESDWSDYLHENVDNTVSLIEKSGIEYKFDVNGNLSSIIDENGNQITFGYDEAGLLSINGHSKYFYTEGFGGPAHKYGLVAKEYKLRTITDDLGRSINLNYDANGLLSTITDFTNRTWTYSYKPSTNDLISVQDPNGLVTSYTYDNGHNLRTVKDANNQTYLTNNYYLVDDVVDSQVYGYGTYVFDYNDVDSLATLTDREGVKTEILYSDAGQVLSETIFTQDPQAEPNSFTTEYFYDPNNLELLRTIYPAGNSVDYTYDDLVNLTGVYRKDTLDEPNDRNDPNVIATTYTYDSVHVNDVNTVTDPRGNVTTFVYDANGNLLTITYPQVAVYGQSPQQPIVEYTYNIHGQVETVTDPNGMVTRFEYYDQQADPNNRGRLWKVRIDPNVLNTTTSYQYDKWGNVREVNDPNGDITKFKYNELSLLTQTTTPSPYSNVTNFYYNKNKKLSQIKKTIDGLNQLTKYDYDKLDHFKTLTDPCNYITTYGYTKNEDPNLVKDAELNSTVSQYNERCLLWKVTDANNGVTEYTYDDNGNLKKIKDPNGDETTYDYDSFGRLKTITYANTKTEGFGYDKNSNITSKTNRNNQTISYTYDAMNRLETKTRPGEAATDFYYDIAGRLVYVDDGRSQSEGGGLTNYYYDRIGRVSQVTNPESRVTSYQYNNKSLRTKLTYPDNSYITYEYDAMGRLAKIKDADGNSVAEYSYDELSRRKLVTLGNDSNAVYTYDISNKLKKLTNNIDDGNTIVFEYANYDKVGNRKSCKIDTANAHAYTYDNLYQLIFVDYNDGNSTSYGYDKRGNRTIADGTAYLRNAMNQYMSVGGTSYSYDNNGNLTNDGTYKYSYDCENRLTDVNEIDNDPVVSYKYDYFGRRVSKTIHASQTTIHYCYDGDRVIAEYSSGGTLLKKYIYGAGIDEVLAMVDVAAGDTYYYHYDALGSVVALSDENGNIVERYSYDVFGAATIRDAQGNIIQQSSVSNRFMFTGREYDYETGNYYYRNRYYNSTIGRFLQTDPIGYIAGLNLYTYCENDSVNKIDPYGLWTEEAHRQLGRYGGGGLNDRFDYARLDIDQPATRSYANRQRHFRQLNDAIEDALTAARNGDTRAFEYHMHEVQDYYAHTAAGYGPKLGHWRKSVDDPTKPNNRNRYQQAEEMTRRLENYWDFHNPQEQSVPENNSEKCSK